MSSSDIMDDAAKSSDYIGTVDPEVTVIYKWIIEQSDIDGKETGESLKSPVIPFSDTNHCRIEFYPKGEAEDCKNYVSVFMEAVKGEFEGRFTFFISHNDKMVSLRRSKTPRLFKADGESWGFRQFSESRLLSNYMYQQCINGSWKRILTIGCQLRIEVNIERGPFFKLEYESRLKELDKFEMLIDNEDFSDVSLEMKGTKLHAHKNILAAKSPVFAAMFTHNMKEREQGNVNIEDIPHNVMKEFLRFIYVGKIDNLEIVAKDLFVAADKYSVESLKSMCESHLMRNIDAQNVFELLNLAALHNSSNLKAESISFFKSNVKKVLQESSMKLYELNKIIMDEVCLIIAESVKN